MKTFISEFVIIWKTLIITPMSRQLSETAALEQIYILPRDFLFLIFLVTGLEAVNAKKGGKKTVF